MKDKRFEELIVVKRSGQRVSFNGTKIVLAIKSAFDTFNVKYSENDINKVYAEVLKYIEFNYKDRKTINVEDIQNIIEKNLKLHNYEDVYLAFNSYRLRRAASREAFSIKQQHKFVKAIETLGLQTNKIDDVPLNMMFDFGKNVSQEFAKAYLLENKHVRAHEEGIIYIHDLNCYPLNTTTASYLDFSAVKSENLTWYLNKLVKIVEKVKQEQTKEQGISNFETLLIPSLISNFKNIFKMNLTYLLKSSGFLDYINLKNLYNNIDKIDKLQFERNILNSYYVNKQTENIFVTAYNNALNELKEVLEKALRETLLALNEINSNLNNNKVVISLGSDTSYEGKLTCDIYLNILAETANLDNVTTIYKIDKIDSINPIVLKLIIEKKNISFSFNQNAEYYPAGEKIYSNINDNRLISNGRMILSSTSINVGRIGLNNQEKPLADFYKELTEVLDLVKNQLMQRFDLQANKYQSSFPHLFKYRLLMDSDKLELDQKIRKVLKNGVLNIGLVGIEEAVYFLKKQKDEKLLLDVLKFINERLIQYTNDNKLNFIVSETNDPQVLKEFLVLDKAIYGINSFSKDKMSYSLITTENFPLAGRIQELLNIVITIPVKKNISYQKLLEIMQTIKAAKILFFKFEVSEK